MNFQLLRFRRSSQTLPEVEDPTAGLVNLFDISVAFISGLILMIFTWMNLNALLRPDTEVTVVQRAPSGEMEVLVKKGRRITAHRVTKRQLTGNGTRLGVAYQLEDGRVVYVPDAGTEP